MKTYVVGMGVVACLTVSGCGTATNGASQTASANNQFVTKASQLYKQYGQFEKTYNTIRTQNKSGTISNAQAYQELTPLETKLESTVTKLGQLAANAPTKYSKPIETLYNSAQDAENAMLDASQALKTDDSSKIAAANTQLQKSNNLYIQFKNQWKQAGGTFTNGGKQG